MTLRALFAAVFLAALLFAGLARAQVSAIVVSACGTPPQTYSPGQFVPITIDTTGHICDTGGGSGGSTTPYSYTHVAGAQFSLAANTATTLTVPATATFASVQVGVSAANYSTDPTTAPTTSAGTTIYTGGAIWLQGLDLLNNFKAICLVSGCVLNVLYYK